MSQESWLVTEPKVIDLPIVHTAKVSLIDGRIDVLASDDETARVEISEVSGKDLLVRVGNGVLEIDHPQLRWDNFVDVFRRSFGGNRARAVVTLVLPRSAYLRLGVVSADALVSGMRGMVRLNSVNGSVMLDDSEGLAEVNSVSGSLSVRDHRGKIAANTVSGDVSATGALTDFSCDGVSGDVFLDTTIAPERVDVNTVSGTTTLRLPADVRARFVVNSVSGTAQLDDAVFSGIKGRTQNWASGPEGGPEVQVRSNSVSGDIVIVRSAPTPSSPESTSEPASPSATAGAA